MPPSRTVPDNSETRHDGCFAPRPAPAPTPDVLEITVVDERERRPRRGAEHQDQSAVETRFEAIFLFRPAPVGCSRPIGDIGLSAHRQIGPGTDRDAFHRAPAIIASSRSHGA